MTRRSVAVIGAGIAGLACAIAAARAGTSVTLLEARPVIAGAPAHVDVVPNMLRGLMQLGVADACVRAGFPYRRTSAIGQRGLPLFSLDAARLAGPRYPGALGTTHDSLHAILLAAAHQAGVVTRAGVRVAGLESDAGPDQRVAIRTDRDPPQAADLVVLACGATGGLRESVFQAPPLPAGGPQWLYFLARRPAGLDDALHGATVAGDRVHVVPVSGSLVGVRLARRQPQHTLDIAAVREALARFPRVIGALAAHFPDDHPIARRAAHPGLLPQPWARAGVVAAGDCAHALPPHFGQSAAQAVEDAVVLGELLAQPIPTHEVMKAYLQRRVARVQAVMDITTQAARWDASPDADTDLRQLARALDQTVAQPA